MKRAIGIDLGGEYGNERMIWKQVVFYGGHNDDRKVRSYTMRFDSPSWERIKRYIANGLQSGKVSASGQYQQWSDYVVRD